MVVDESVHVKFYVQYLYNVDSTDESSKASIFDEMGRNNVLCDAPVEIWTQLTL